MRAAIGAAALMGWVLAGCAGTAVESPIRPLRASHEGAASEPLASAAAIGIPGCAATLSVNVRQLIQAPSLAEQAAMLWSEARRSLLREEIGPEALADLARLGIRRPSDIHSVEVCMTAAPGSAGTGESDRIGLLVRGPFTQGLFTSLVRKWADERISGLWQHEGIDIVRLDDGTLFSQRPDGGLVVARRTSALIALLEAPPTPAHSHHAIALHAPNIGSLLDRKPARDDFPADAVQSLALDIDAKLDRVHVTLLARDPLAASQALAWLHTLTTDAAREIETSRDSQSLDYAFASVIASATVTQNDHAITVVAPLGLQRAALLDKTANEITSSAARTARSTRSAQRARLRGR